MTGLASDRPWAALGPQAVQDRAELTRSTLTALQSPSGQGTPAAGAVLRLALEERLRSDLALHDSGFLPGLVAPLASPAHAVMMGLESAAPDQRLDGLAQVPAALRDYAAQLQETARHGYVVPARQSRTLAAQVRRWADPAGDDRLGALLNGAEDAQAPHTAAAAVLTDARAACHELATWLEEVHAPRGAANDAVGPELYGITSSAFLGTRVDLAQTYRYGWELLGQLTAQARALAAELGASSACAPCAGGRSRPPPSAWPRRHRRKSGCGPRNARRVRRPARRRPHWPGSRRPRARRLGRVTHGPGC